MSIKKGFLYMKKKLSLRKKRSLETKKTLYANSIKLFNEKGYDNVTVDEIVGVSGFAK
jgi:AcrR family transcriptional regulator